MQRFIIIKLLFILPLLSTACTVSTSEQENYQTSLAVVSPETADRVVFINGVQIPESSLQAMEQRYGFTIQEGRYWYDNQTGLWGMEGGPGLGFILPGLELGGPLKANASNGYTGVFVNGRELHTVDVMRLQTLGPVYRGRYWLDAYGYFGFEGGPAIGNLIQIAQQKNTYQSGGNQTFYRNGYTGIGGGSDGKTSYVIGSDFSVIVDH